MCLPGGGVLDEHLAGKGGALAQVVVDDAHRLLVPSQRQKAKDVRGQADVGELPETLSNSG